MRIASTYFQGIPRAETATPTKQTVRLPFSQRQIL